MLWVKKGYALALILLWYHHVSWAFCHWGIIGRPIARFMIPPYVPSRRIRLPQGIESGSQDGEKSADDEARVSESPRIGLDGQWVVESGEAQSTEYGDTHSENTPPGQLPQVTADGKEWDEWAREWRENPAAKADRLVNAWNAEAAARGKQPIRQVDTEVRPKSIRKGKGGKQKGSSGPSLGFGSPAARRTKGVPKRLVVKDVASDDGGPDGGSSKDEDLVVDWSEGQELMEHKKRDFTGEMEYETERIKTMDPRDREQLRKRLRSALGKDETRPSEGSSTRTPHPAAGRGMETDGIDQVESNSPEREDVGEKVSVSMPTTQLGDVAKGELGSGDDFGETREIKEAQGVGSKQGAIAASDEKKIVIDSSVGSKTGSGDEATMSTVVVDDASNDKPDTIPEIHKYGYDDEDEELIRIRRSFGLGRSGAGGAGAGAGAGAAAALAGAKTIQTPPRTMEMSNDSREPSTETQERPATLGKEGAERVAPEFMEDTKGIGSSALGGKEADGARITGGGQGSVQELEDNLQCLSTCDENEIDSGVKVSADEDGQGIGGDEEERDRIRRAFGLGAARSAAVGADATTGRDVDA